MILCFAHLKGRVIYPWVALAKAPKPLLQETQGVKLGMKEEGKRTEGRETELCNRTHVAAFPLSTDDVEHLLKLVLPS